MNAKYADSFLGLCGATSFLAFLVTEPFKPEILSYFANGFGHGWVAFISFRLVLILMAIVSFFLLCPFLDKYPARMVPMPEHGNDPLLTLRTFAFILVVAGHGLVVVFHPSDISELLNAGSKVWLAMGSPWAGVWVFFVLSGYLMAKGFYRGRYDLSRSKILDFYKNRLRRIAPIYCLVLVVAAIISSPEIFEPSNWWQIVALATFSQQNGSPHPVIGALWSIQTEMAFYALVPLLVLAVNKATLKLPLWLVVGLLLAFGLAYRVWIMTATDSVGWLDRVYIPLIGNLDLFLLGMVANWVLPSASRWLKDTPTLSVGLALLVPLYVITTYYFAEGSYGIHAKSFLFGIQTFGPTLVGATTFCVIILFEHHVFLRVKAALVPRRIVYATQSLGLLTYALYSWHEPIFLNLRKIAGSDLSFSEAVSWLLLALVITTAIAAVTFWIFEKPFEARKSPVAAKAS